MKLAADFRKRAREALKGHWFIAMIAGFLASVLGGTIVSSMSLDFEYKTDADSNVNTDEIESIISGQWDSPEVLNILIIILAIFSVVAIISTLFYMIVGGAVGIGYAKFNLDLMDKNEIRIGTLFDHFSELKKGFSARLLQFIYTFLWSLLFIIPGIVASFSYVMVHHVIADNPEMTAREALRESKRIMKGNRWRFFCMTLSFIGWELLGIFTAGIITVWVVPYQHAAIAAFYRDITGTEKQDEVVA
jgi:uncharacterized membrane protein